MHTPELKIPVSPYHEWAGKMQDIKTSLMKEGGAKVIDGDINIYGKILMQGQHDRSTGLWTVPLDNTRISSMAQKYIKRQGKISNKVYKFMKVYNTIQYLHAAAFSPVTSKFIKAIDAGNFTTLLNLMTRHINQYPEKSEATIKGHMNQERKNVRSRR
jgi:hypothetical protein